MLFLPEHKKVAEQFREERPVWQEKEKDGQGYLIINLVDY